MVATSSEAAMMSSETPSKSNTSQQVDNNGGASKGSGKKSGKGKGKGGGKNNKLYRAADFWLYMAVNGGMNPYAHLPTWFAEAYVAKQYGFSPPKRRIIHAADSEDPFAMPCMYYQGFNEKQERIRKQEERKKETQAKRAARYEEKMKKMTPQKKNDEEENDVEMSASPEQEPMKTSVDTTLTSSPVVSPPERIAQRTKDLDRMKTKPRYMQYRRLRDEYIFPKQKDFPDMKLKMIMPGYAKEFKKIDEFSVHSFVDPAEPDPADPMPKRKWKFELERWRRGVQDLLLQWSGKERIHMNMSEDIEAAEADESPRTPKPEGVEKEASKA